MADKPLTFRIGAEDDASKVFQKISKTAKSEMGKVDDSLEDGRTSAQKLAAAYSQLADDLDAELTDVKATADKLAQALGPELAAKVDSRQLVQEFRKVGLSLDDIKGEADTLATAVKKLDDVQLKHVGSEARTLADKDLGHLRDSSDQTRSVMANLAGNTAQDLGAVGGAAGTAGVAIGQLAEYAVDGNINLGKLIQFAGPMAALGVVAGGVATAIGGINAEKAFRAELVEKFTDALRDAKSVAQEIKSTVEETGKLEFSNAGHGFLGLGNAADDLIPVLARLHVTLDEFVGFAERGAGEGIRKTAFEMQKAANTTDEWRQVFDLKSLADGLDQYGQAAIDATTRQKDLNFVLGTAVDETDRASAAHAAFQQIVAQSSGATGELDERTKALNATLRDISQTMHGVDWKTADINSAVTAMSAYNRQAFALGNIQQGVRESFDALGESIKDGDERIALTGDTMTEAGRKQQDAIEGVAQALELEFAAAYDKADGSQRKFIESATKIGDDTLKQLQDQLGLTDDEVALLRDQLNFTAKDYEARFELSGEEEARTKIGLLQSAIDGLPENVQTKVEQEIIQGDYQGALAIIQGWYDDHHPQAHVDAAPGADNASAWLEQIARDRFAHYYAVTHPADVNPGSADAAGFTGATSGGATPTSAGGIPPVPGRARQAFEKAAELAAHADKIREEAKALREQAEAIEDAEEKEKKLAEAKKKVEQADDLMSRSAEKATDAIRAQADALQSNADALRTDADAQREHADALTERANSFGEVVDAASDLQRAQFAAADAARAVAEADRTTRVGSRERAEAYLQARDAAENLAEAEVELARQRAERRGDEFSDLDALRVRQQSLQRQMRGAGNAAVRVEIKDLIKDLNFAQERRLLKQAERERKLAEKQETAADKWDKVADKLLNGNIERVLRVNVGRDGQITPEEVIRLIKQYERRNGARWRR